jgi:hypothetical protein
MPQLATITLTDRQDTPVTHAFTPQDVNPETRVGILVESDGTPIGNNLLSVSSRRMPSGKYKAKLGLKIPVVMNETINGVTRPTIVRTHFLNLECSFEESSTEDERNDAIGMFVSALAESQTLTYDAIVKLQGVY